MIKVEHNGFNYEVDLDGEQVRGVWRIEMRACRHSDKKRRVSSEMTRSWATKPELRAAALRRPIVAAVIEKAFKTLDKAC